MTIPADIFAPMGSTPPTPHNPLIAKRKAAAEAANRRRQTAAETSAKLAVETNAFFDTLALLNAGALTFSVTLLGHPSQAQSLFYFVYAAWIFLLIALAACLVRNYSNLGHRFYSVASSRAESEIALINADAVSVLSDYLKYDDAAEPFDKNRELKINKENRDEWQRELARTKRKADSGWRLHGIAEWTVFIAMCLDFLLLIVFAIFRTQLSG